MRRASAFNNYMTPSLVIGTLISILSAFLLQVFNVTDFGVSFVIGLSGMSLSAALDLIDRSEYAAIFKAPPWLRSEVARLGDLAQGVLERNVRALDDELRSVVTTAISEAGVLASGRLERDATDTRMLLDLVSRCEIRLAAMTNIAERGGASRLDWWQSEFGRRYWEANCQALARGVTIDRVFLYEVLDDGLLDIVRIQREAGVNAYLIEALAVPSQYRGNLAVFDDVCAWESRMDAYATITRNVFYYATSDIKRCKDLVDTLVVRAKAHALPLDDAR